jgi:hypothetical protein
VVLYLAHIKKTSKSVHAVKMHSASISAFHDKNFLESACREKAVQDFISGCQRQLGKPVVSREAMTKQIIRNIVRFCVKDSVRLTQPLQFWKEAVFELSAFLGLCRFSDLERLTWDRVSISGEGVTMSFLTRKNDQKHLGHKVFLMATGGEFCPVKIFGQYYKYLSEAFGGNFPSKGFFLPVLDKRGGKYFPSASKAASHSGMRGVQISVMLALGLDWKVFGLHSGKIGGAIEAARANHSKSARNSFGGWGLGSDMADYYDKKLASRSIKAIACTLRIF